MSSEEPFPELADAMRAVMNAPKKKVEESMAREQAAKGKNTKPKK